MHSKLIQDMGKTLTETQIEEVAQSIGLTYAHLKAFLVTETASQGFYGGTSPTLIPVVRFENHKFAQFTDYKYNTTHPHLSSLKFTNKYNLKGIAEFGRFDQAYRLDGQAAVEATSWGIGQIMGFNWKSCGYSNIGGFLNDAFDSEHTQLIMMANFLQHSSPSLLKAIKAEKWATVALLYNGQGYASNKYDKKLEEAYSKYLK